MKTRFLTLIALSLSLFCHAQTDRIAASPDGDVSLKLEIERAIDKGVKYLKSQQDAESGSWSEPKIPAFSALALSAMLGDPSRDLEAPLDPEIEKGLDFLLANQKPDGGIYGKGLATYNTSLAIMALTQAGQKEHYPVIAKARRLLINQQQDFDRRGQVDNLFDGGVGYGGSYAHSDLSNTHMALGALYYSKQLLADTEFAENDFDLDWDAAIEFVSLCQNSDASAERMGEGFGVREEDKGGFVYFPGSTKSDTIQLTEKEGERVALRSYGSISYAGILAFIYAEMDQDDPRLQTALEWIQANYTLEENPGMDAQGLYYYYHTMSKALSIAKINKLETADGKSIDWRQQLALKVMSTQSPDGSWTNAQSNRWLEDDPILVTAYSMIALGHIYRGL